MRRNVRLAHAALTSLLVTACGTTGALPTASPATPAITRSAQPTRSPQPTTTPAAPSGQPSPAEASCAGDDLLWDLLPPSAQAYALAWVSIEPTERVTRLEEGMTADASYADPGTVLSGLPAIAEHIGAFQRGNPEHFLRVRVWEPNDEHHGFVRLRWMLCRQIDARSILEGEDILILADAGLIRQATRFLDR